MPYLSKEKAKIKNRYKHGSSLNVRSFVCVWTLVTSGSAMKDVSTIIAIVSAVVIVF